MKRIINLFVIFLSAIIFSGCKFIDYLFSDFCSLYSRMFKGDWFDIMMGIVITVLLLSAILMVINFIIQFSNYIGTKKIKTSGFVSGKEHETGTSLVMMPLSTGGAIPIYNKLDNYILEIEIKHDNKKVVANFNTNKKAYQNIQQGQEVAATYQVGRFGGVKICSLEII